MHPVALAAPSYHSLDHSLSLLYTVEPSLPMAHTCRITVHVDPLVGPLSLRTGGSGSRKVPTLSGNNVYLSTRHGLSGLAVFRCITIPKLACTRAIIPWYHRLHKCPGLFLLSGKVLVVNLGMLYGLRSAGAH